MKPDDYLDTKNKPVFCYIYEGQVLMKVCAENSSGQFIPQLIMKSPIK